MSSNRRTAFARVPRGTSGTGTAVPANITINKQFLDRMTQARLAPDMMTILTKANAELNITVQPNGKGNFTINSGGRVIGDSTDVQKVQSLGTFVNDERKSIVKTSVSAMAKKTIAAIVQVSRDPAFIEQVPRPIRNVDKSFVDVFRTINSQAEMLDANLRQVSQLSAAGHVNEMVRNHLIETGSRVREALGKYLFYRGGLAEGEEPLKLNEYLIRGSILGWVFTRLCSQKMQLGGKDFEFRKVYFPKDPTKGLQITFREFRDSELLHSQGGILENMGLFRGLLSNDSVRAICGVPSDWDLTEFQGPAKALANVPIPVVPCRSAVTVEEHFSILAQNGDRGLPWNVGNTLTPQDTLKFLGTIPKRIAYGFLGRPRFSAPWYEKLFSGFRFDASIPDREGRSVFSQLLSQFRAGTIRTDFFTKVKGEAGFPLGLETFPPLVLAVMDLPPESDLGRDTLNRLTEGPLAIPNGETKAITDAWAAITSRRNMTDEQCAALLSGVLATNLDPRSKDARKGDIRQARSGLSPQGSLLLREFKRRGYHALASRVDQWLRSFLTSDLQGSVAEVIAARLEASLATPIQFGRGDAAVFLEAAEFAPDSVQDEEEEHVTDVDNAENPDDQM